MERTTPPVLCFAEAGHPEARDDDDNYVVVAQPESVPAAQATPDAVRHEGDVVRGLLRSGRRGVPSARAIARCRRQRSALATSSSSFWWAASPPPTTRPTSLPSRPSTNSVGMPRTPNVSCDSFGSFAKTIG